MMRGTATPDASVSACRCRYAPALEGEGNGRCFILPIVGSLRPLVAGFRFTHEKGRGSRACAAGAPGEKMCYDFFIVELPNLGVSLYGFPQFWQILFDDIFEGETCLKSL